MSFEGKLARARAAKEAERKASKSYIDRENKKKELQSDPRYSQMKKIANSSELHSALEHIVRKGHMWVEDLTGDRYIGEKRLGFRVNIVQGMGEFQKKYVVKIGVSDSGIIIRSFGTSQTPTMREVHPSLESFLDALAEAMA